MSVKVQSRVLFTALDENAKKLSGSTEKSPVLYQKKVKSNFHNNCENVDHVHFFFF